MEDPSSTPGLGPAKSPGSYAAELQAFIATMKATRPEPWAQVERLHQLVREVSPATVFGATRARQDLAEIYR